LAFLKAESEWDGPMFMYAAVTVCSEIHPWCGPYHFSSRGLRGDRAVTVKKCDNSTISLEFSSTGKSTMKISIKNLQQESFQVEIAPTSTVSLVFCFRQITHFNQIHFLSQVKELKQKIEKDKGAHEYKAALQKLIYSGMRTL
jgi:hypothetical protein